MNIINNNYDLSFTELGCNIHIVCNYITSKINNIKNFIFNLFKKEKTDKLTQYSYHYNALRDVLSLFDNFKQEYKALFKVNKIIEYIFRNYSEITPSMKKFMSDTWNSFSTLLEYKLYLIENKIPNSEELYNKKYLQFKSALKEYNNYFYTEIYGNTHQYDETIREISKILLE